MKLYATITSERATKGQGGKWLEIVVLDEKQKKLLDLRIEHDEKAINKAKIKAIVYTSHDEITRQFGDMYVAKPISGEGLSQYEEEKGKKQKGEMVYFCEECGHIENWSHILLKEKGEPVCPNCDTDLTLQI